MPNTANVKSNFFLEFPASTIAPIIGALIAIKSPTNELADPMIKVLSASGKSDAQ